MGTETIHVLSVFGVIIATLFVYVETGLELPARFKKERTVNYDDLVFFTIHTLLSIFVQYWLLTLLLSPTANTVTIVAVVLLYTGFISYRIYLVKLAKKKTLVIQEVFRGLRANDILLPLLLLSLLPEGIHSLFKLFGLE